MYEFTLQFVLFYFFYKYGNISIYGIHPNFIIIDFFLVESRFFFFFFVLTTKFEFYGFFSSGQYFFYRQNWTSIFYLTAKIPSPYAPLWSSVMVYRIHTLLQTFGALSPSPIKKMTLPLSSMHALSS